MTLNDRLEITIEDHVAEVVLNRPDKMNALDMDMFYALDEAARSLAGESSVRVVVLRGAGENFCAGIDLDVLQGGADIGAALLDPVQDSPANIFSIR